ncbi:MULTISPECIES: response regulator transcription factor [Trichocoleus]|uniref:Response regulator transcription factor n=1 Tax=Trichocoleus desertorum GB2-A4 TaxID=2933944 RepID=A0ABV0JHG0_9CYAN|nr:response regulator transcription factor [Trichocoleus sp. FACHB-46]MBD1864518.1 response regulator transcription factor [Trichocoleus sp. FACHB-46]
MAFPPLKILLVEDDELFRLGLRVRLEQESGLEIVAEAEDGETAIEIVKCHVLNIVVLDIGLPGLGGIEACRQIRKLALNLPILVLTSHTQKALINRIIEVGAQGYCVKGAPSHSLILAIRSVAVGASWWDSAATTEIRAAFENNSGTTATRDSEKMPPVLTRREQEILALITDGKTNQEIAQILYIAPGTVRVHVHAILQKLDVRDRTQAAIIAIQNKLIARDLLSEH